MDLDRVLSECAAQVLDEVLGASCAKAISYHMGVNLSVENVGRFLEELERIFGIGSNVLEKGIIEELNLQFGKKVPVKNGMHLTDYINWLQRSIDNNH